MTLEHGATKTNPAMFARWLLVGFVTTGFLAGAPTRPIWAAEGNTAPAQPALRQPDLSLRNEIQHAIDRGLAWLQENQNSNGWWSTPDHPAITGLALTAFAGERRFIYRDNLG
jgi:hypothetical protein